MLARLPAQRLRPRWRQTKSPTVRAGVTAISWLRESAGGKRAFDIGERELRCRAASSRRPLAAKPNNALAFRLASGKQRDQFFALRRRQQWPVSSPEVIALTIGLAGRGNDRCHGLMTQRVLQEHLRPRCDARLRSPAW